MTSPETDPRQDLAHPDSWSVDASGYDAAFAPFTALFATDAVARLQIGPGDRVLDVAAGSGAFTLAAAATGAGVLATDFAPGMIDVLNTRLENEPDANVTTAVIDGQALDLDDDSFDVAGSMSPGRCRQVDFVPDLDAGLHELVRVVRSGGRIDITTWDISSYRLPELIANAARAVVPDIEFPAPPPRSPRVGSIEGMKETLTSAGGRDVTVTTLEHPLVLDDPEAFHLAIPEWSAPLRPRFGLIPMAARPEMARAFGRLAREVGATVGGPVQIPWTALLGTGVAP